MHKIFLIFILLIPDFCLASKSEREFAENPKVGFLVMGMSFTPKRKADNLLFKIRRLDEKWKGKIEHNDIPQAMVRVPPFKNDDDIGAVAVKRLPPGRYELYDFLHIQDIGIAVKKYSSGSELSIPFDIREGQATYLGNYQFNWMWRRNKYGKRWWLRPVFLVSDRQEEQLASFTSANPPGFQGVSKAVPDPDALKNASFLRFIPEADRAH